VCCRAGGFGALNAETGWAGAFGTASAMGAFGITGRGCGVGGNGGKGGGTSAGTRALAPAPTPAPGAFDALTADTGWAGAFDTTVSPAPSTAADANGVCCRAGAFGAMAGAGAEIGTASMTDVFSTGRGGGEGGNGGAPAPASVGELSSSSITWIAAVERTPRLAASSTNRACSASPCLAVWYESLFSYQFLHTSTS
jgi:hypothetical protein